MTELMVTPYAPYRDGIANYAVQEVAAARAAGRDMEVLSPLPSAAQHHLRLGSALGMGRLIRFARGYDRVVLQLYPELLFGACRGRRERLAVWGLLRVLCSVTKVELRVHEIEYDEPAGDPQARRLGHAALSAAAAVTVHTEPEQQRLTEAFDLAPGTVTLVDHGINFSRRTETTREDARASLGVPADAFVFLSIGFVQRHKGFDRGVRALDRLDDPDGRARIYVVGDIRIDHPDLLDYREELDSLCRRVGGAEFRPGYVSDEEFDRWLVAADCLVLPYREIWSSSVIERAGIYDVPVIATDVGGLAAQAPAGSRVVADDDALAAAMAEVAGLALGAETARDAADVPREQAAIQRLIRERADDGGRAPLEADRLHHTPRASTDSARPGIPQVKRLIARVTAWQVEPVAGHLDEVIDRLRTDLRHLEERIADLEGRND
ncbi:glycosyltransferase family 4 protein [Acidimicrobiia bacterium EGI L10123]|uniref:glycosyltransferase family 4 protein n=1 Tax=Salinilacustrithrix flava TaxID=2957203 RepID=UPI003D7C2FCE|nr:glycosyltransferase family 4 protein [Acidimicrobiia bacterium EGI L10123]